MSIIRPIVIVNQLVGVCPHEIAGGEILVFRLRSLKVVRTIITLLIMSTYSVYLTIQFYFSFQRNRPMPEKVNLGMWCVGSFLPVSMLIATFIKRNRMTLFFEKMREFKTPLKGMITCDKTLAYSRRLYVAYIFLGAVSCGFTCNLLIRNPRTDISILANLDREPTSEEIALACCFQCYVVIIKSCAIAYIEVLCCSLATCFCNTLTAIRTELQRSLDGSPRFRQSFSAAGNNKISSGGMNSNKNMADHPYIQKVNEGRREIMYPVLSARMENTGDNRDLSYSALKPTAVDGYNSANYYDQEFDSDGTGQIMLAIKRYNCVANMQRLINCIFGQLLMLDTGFLVFMSCLLLFLQINYMGSGVVDGVDAIIFTVNFMAFSIRTVVIFINLGAVYGYSACFNGTLSSFLMQVNNPKPMDVNMILAHLMSSSANPIAFSAGGFFTFSRSSLLAVMSGIMTYVVFLLQAKN